MKRLLWASIAIMLVGSLLAGCQQSVPSAAEATGGPAAKATAGASKPAWEQQWDNTVAEARKEGKLVFLGAGGAQLRDVGMDKTLNQQFGLTLELVGGRASEITTKIVAEQRAGIYSGDIFLLSAITFINLLKPNGLTESLDHVIFLPEALNPKAWYKGELPWIDKDHHQLGLLAVPVATVLINTDMVKPAEIKSFRDLLNPRWKGKIVLVDPTQLGAGAEWFSAMAEGIMDLNYMRELAKQEPVVTRDDRLAVEWVARGKYPITIGPATRIVEEFKVAGAPIKAFSPVEGTYVGTSSAALTVLKNPVHPNAAKLFANWIMTREGITWVSKAYGGQSARVDAPTDFLDPDQLRQPGMKYLDSSNEEYSMRQAQYLKLSAEVFAGSLKK